MNIHIQKNNTKYIDPVKCYKSIYTSTDNIILYICLFVTYLLYNRLHIEMYIHIIIIVFVCLLHIHYITICYKIYENINQNMYKGDMINV